MERERDRHIHEEEKAHLRHSLASFTERYDALMKQYQKLQETCKDLTHAESTHSVVQTRLQQLEAENEDTMHQVRSWQEAHSALAESLHEVSVELAEQRGQNQRMETLEMELAEHKRTGMRLQELTESYQQVSDKLHKSVGECECLSLQLCESRRSVDGLSIGVEEMQQLHDDTVARLEEELLNAQAEARHARAQMEALCAVHEEVVLLREQIMGERTLREEGEKRRATLEADNKILSEAIEKLLHRIHKEKDERENFIDRRLISQMIHRHAEQRGNIKRRDQIFLLICDVIGLSEAEKERLGLFADTSKAMEAVANKNLSDQFMEFLDSEIQHDDQQDLPP
eukprot:GHVS01033420.1.p1 GENE.GHVS01033420.1~~GHVS01033420.1.p1  ORF type:complete len:342 (-),score=71.97 GHVS01033420.1:524-1549(-)